MNTHAINSITYLPHLFQLEKWGDSLPQAGNPTPHARRGCPILYNITAVLYSGIAHTASFGVAL